MFRWVRRINELDSSCEKWTSPTFPSETQNLSPASGCPSLLPDLVRNIFINCYGRKSVMACR